MSYHNFSLQDMGDGYYKDISSDPPSLSLILVNTARLVLQSVSKDYRIHSVQCYIASPLNPDEKITYRLQKIRDGRNFSIRFVDILQNQKTIQILEYSLQNITNINPNVTYTPQFPRNVEDAMFYPSQMKKLPILGDVGTNVISSKENSAFRWLKLNDVTDDIKDITLLILSDYSPFSELCDQPFDHSIWIHEREFDPTEWLLHEVEIIQSGDDKYLLKGRIWSRGGRLLLSFVQERVKRRKSKL